MRVARKIIEIDDERCDGCGQCVPACAEGAIEIFVGKARVVSENYCDGLGACVGECPKGALKVVERLAEEFDAEAVEAFAKANAEAQTPGEASMACDCPSAQVQSFPRPILSHETDEAVTPSGTASALSHWPVQIRLVPPTASFLKGAHLLVAADCTAVAYPEFHQDFLRGNAVMVGCPKFDDGQAYIEKFSDIFRTAAIRKITVVVMEVPCCQGLPLIVKKGMEAAGKHVPMEQVVVSVRGEILEQKKLP